MISKYSLLLGCVLSATAAFADSSAAVPEKSYDQKIWAGHVISSLSPNSLKSRCSLQVFFDYEAGTSSFAYEGSDFRSANSKLILNSPQPDLDSVSGMSSPASIGGDFTTGKIKFEIVGIETSSDKSSLRIHARIFKTGIFGWPWRISNEEICEASLVSSQ